MAACFVIPITNRESENTKRSIISPASRHFKCLKIHLLCALYQHVNYITSRSFSCIFPPAASINFYSNVFSVLFSLVRRFCFDNLALFLQTALKVLICEPTLNRAANPPNWLWLRQRQTEQLSFVFRLKC